MAIGAHSEAISKWMPAMRMLAMSKGDDDDDGRRSDSLEGRRADTYPVCYFMDLARSDECRAFCRGSNLWPEKQ